MLGSGHWNTPNKKLPGLYIRFTSDHGEYPEKNSSGNDKLLVDKNGIYLKTKDNKYLVVRTSIIGGTYVRTNLRFRTSSN